jgi:hypothetical protein
MSSLHALLLPIVVAGLFGPGLQQINAVSVFLFLPLVLSYSRATMVGAGRRQFWTQVRDRK